LPCKALEHVWAKEKAKEDVLVMKTELNLRRTKGLRRAVNIVSVIALLILTPAHAAPAKPMSDTAFAYRLCGLYQDTYGHASFAGSGAGCTWGIGHGDVGETSTEIEMLAIRNIGPEKIVETIKGFDDLYAKFAIVPGYKLKTLAINCDTSGAPAQVVFWGIPSKSNIMGYAVCKNSIVFGEIHSPPDSDIDAEALFIKRMKATAGLTNL
jgi:hypothetical protein